MRIFGVFDKIFKEIMEKILNQILVPNIPNVMELPLLSLAFLGDAVHTAFVRKKVLEGGLTVSANLHKCASALCSAKAQAQMLDLILQDLSAEEQDLVRRARNQKTHKPPKNANLETYKKATCFECLLGYFLVSHKLARLANVLEQSFEVIKEKL